MRSLWAGLYETQSISYLSFLINNGYNSFMLVWKPLLVTVSVGSPPPQISARPSLVSSAETGECRNQASLALLVLWSILLLSGTRLIQSL